MTLQLDLPLDRRTHVPEVTPDEVQKMIAILIGKGWRTAAQLGATTESQKRSLRAICRASKGHIISGQKGYKLTIEANIEEIRSTVWLKNQGKDMVRHWVEIQRVAHPIIAAAAP